MTELIIKVDDDFLREANLKGMETQFELVRCKDCKYQDKGENECESWNLCGYRPWLHIPTSDDHFCASGERKDGDSE